MPTELEPSSPISTLPLIGDVKQQQLLNLNIETVKDLLFHIPFRYKDTSEVLSILEYKDRMEGTILAKVVSVKTIYTRSRKVFTKAILSDDKDEIGAIWFNQKYIEKALKTGEWYLFEGKISPKSKTKDISSPKFELYSEDQTHVGTITPHYNETAGITSKWLRSRIKTVKDEIPKLIQDSMPEKYLSQYQLPSLSKAISLVQFPTSFKKAELGRARLEFDEMLTLMTKIEQRKNDHNKKKAIQIQHEHDDIFKFIDSLPFELTEDQFKAAKEILQNIGNKVPIKRLLNGDVGSGKTVIAAIAAYAIYLAKHTTIIMAPTTILAKQHHNTLTKLFEPFKIDIVLKTSNEQIGDISENSIIVATHAILFEQNLPQDIALLIVDEQHKFGVKQREQLLQINSQGKTPHYLTMTATPIPRTLTNILFGDMDVSIIKQMPKHKKTVQSYTTPYNKRESCFTWTKEKIELSDNIEQAFIIFPLIEESEVLSAKAVTTEYEILSKGVFKNLSVGILHGQMKEEEKQSVMKHFVEKKINILISTTVIEVGIDIPDATIMIIENAERFGLAQLHQLRGRIGRGVRQGYCYVIPGEEVLEDSEQYTRLQYFTKHSSGFDVAEYDLQTRGPGEVYGYRQSGIPNFKVANIQNTDLIKIARDVAKSIISDDSKNKVMKNIFR